MLNSTNPNLLAPIFASIQLGEGPIGQYVLKLEEKSVRSDSVRKYCGIKRHYDSSASTVQLSMLLLVASQFLLMTVF
jgi:hypothetical protein